ncbi:hypothetical protein N431DRAFT_461328 [Stipitochalara longipes BDJ]|nr:hypothetical protein N431DRAFT_461328 [Stipitochalara longipes BDJ]
MFTQKLLLPAFAVITAVAAQSATICSAPTATINSNADASQYSSCSSISGSVVIGSAASGDIQLNGPQTIGGDLTILNATALTSFSSSSIEQIKGTFHVEALTLLSTLQMNVLTAVKTINFVSLPNLGSLTFSSGVTSAQSVTVSNTFLNTLAGINVTTVTTLQVDNNPHLIEFTSQLGNISSAAVFNANGANLAVSFPFLTWASNLTFRDVGSVDLPSLQVINGSLGFYENSLETINLPNLTTVGSFATGVGSLAFVDNTALTNISVNALKSVGGADQIANNTLLSSISFPALVDVGGAIDFSGNFTTPGLGALGNVKGGFNVESKQAIDCTKFKAEASPSGVIQGKFVCEGGLSSVSSLGTGTSTGSSASATGSKGAAVSFGVNEAAAGLSVLGGLLQILL